VSLRAAWRGVKLAIALLRCFLRYSTVWLAERLHGRRITPLQRAQWMSFCGRTVLTAMGVHWRSEGRLPRGAVLIVSNHLSYLDIAVFAAIMPCAFVSRHDVENWPVFGAIAKIGETIFVDRMSRASALAATSAIAEKISEGVPVVLFPEGTSTDGSAVLRFHSPLFAPVAEEAVAVVPAAIRYLPWDGAEERELCWYGDAEFVPHLKKVLAGPQFSVLVCFGEPQCYADRRIAAAESHAAVVALRTEASRTEDWNQAPLS
jgi:1-acyl-sn-glycerol-3-phosphate acyltransferase